MDSSNIDSHSEAEAFNKLNRFLYKYYPLLLKTSKIGEHVNQFFVFSYNCVPRSFFDQMFDQIVDAFESIYRMIISKIQKCLLNGSGWIIDSVVNHTINI